MISNWPLRKGIEYTIRWKDFAPSPIRRVGFFFGFLGKRNRKKHYALQSIFHAFPFFLYLSFHNPYFPRVQSHSSLFLFLPSLSVMNILNCLSSPLPSLFLLLLPPTYFWGIDTEAFKIFFAFTNGENYRKFETFFRASALRSPSMRHRLGNWDGFLRVVSKWSLCKSIEYSSVLCCVLSSRRWQLPFFVNFDCDGLPKIFVNIAKGISLNGFAPSHGPQTGFIIARPSLFIQNSNPPGLTSTPVSCFLWFCAFQRGKRKTCSTHLSLIFINKFW